MRALCHSFVGFGVGFRCQSSVLPYVPHRSRFLCQWRQWIEKGVLANVSTLWHINGQLVITSNLRPPSLSGWLQPANVLNILLLAHVAGACRFVMVVMHLTL